MKKLFVCALAASMFTACSQDETISQQSPMQISFDGAFVNKASRADKADDWTTTTAKLTGFDVWGYMDDQTGRIFGDGDNGEDVTGSKGNFTYVNEQYWYAGHTFNFFALAPLNSDNATVTPPAEGEIVKGLSNVNFKNLSGTEDLLYATYERNIPTGADLSQYSDAVKFTFYHLLSKVKFSFKNTYTNPNIHFEVYDIQMTAPKVGNINLNNADWATNSKWELVGTDVTPLAFGTTNDIAQGKEQECATERLTIPATAEQKYLVTFKVKLYNGGVLVNQLNEAGEVIPYSHDITLTGVDFEIGKAYDLYAELNADNIIDPEDPYYEDENSYPIVFDVEVVDGWDQATDEKVDDYLVETGEEMMLITDATINGSLNLKNSILNGAGNTLYAASEPTNRALISPEGTVTIKNLTIDGGNKYTTSNANLRAFYATKPGNYTIENVEFIGTGYALNISLSSGETTLNVSNSTFEGWTSYSACVTATFTNVNFTCGTYELLGDDAPYHKGYFRPYGQTELNGCKFEVGYKIDMGSLGTGKTIKFIDCYYGSEKITASNIETLAFIDNYDATKIEF